MKFIYVLIVIALTGCDPAKKTTAGAQAIKFDKQKHPFFDFIKNIKPLNKDLLFCTLTKEVIEKYKDSTNKEYLKKDLFSIIYNDFKSLADLMIKNKLFQNYLSNFDKNLRESVKTELLTKYDYSNDFNAKCTSMIDENFLKDAMENYFEIIKLANDRKLEVDKTYHNSALENNGVFVKYFEENELFIKLITADLNIEELLGNYIINKKDNNATSLQKLFNFYGYNFLMTPENESSDAFDKRIEEYIFNKKLLSEPATSKDKKTEEE